MLPLSQEHIGEFGAKPGSILGPMEQTRIEPVSLLPFALGRQGRGKAPPLKSHSRVLVREPNAVEPSPPATGPAKPIDPLL